MGAILAIDVGTQSARVVIWDETGAPCFRTSRPLAVDHDLPTGFVHQDGLEIADATRAVVREALVWAESQPIHLEAAGLAVQRSTVVAWNRSTRQPLGPAISWMDRRGADWLYRHAASAELVQEMTGLAWSAHYGATKLAWLSAQESVRNEPCATLGPLASFLVEHLVAPVIPWVDLTNAHRTQLVDLATGDWSESLLSLFGVPHARLPRIGPAQAVYGDLLASRLPLVLVCGDQQAAWWSSGREAICSVHLNLGTGAFLLAAAPETLRSSTRLVRSPSPRRTSDGPTISPASPARAWGSLHCQEQGTGGVGPTPQMLEGTVNGAGSLLRWAAEHWAVTLEALPWEIWWKAWTHRLVASEWRNGDPGDECPLFVNRWGGLGSPWWNSNATCAWINANGQSIDEPVDPQRVFPALVESIVTLIVANLEALRSAGVRPRSLRVSGGLTNVRPLLELLAMQVECPVEVQDDPDATARGTAWLTWDALQQADLRADLRQAGWRVGPDDCDDNMSSRFRRSGGVAVETPDAALARQLAPILRQRRQTVLRLLDTRDLPD